MALKINLKFYFVPNFFVKAFPSARKAIVEKNKRKDDDHELWRVRRFYVGVNKAQRKREKEGRQQNLMAG
jgi:hypothetical protein